MVSKKTLRLWNQQSRELEEAIKRQQVGDIVAFPPEFHWVEGDKTHVVFERPDGAHVRVDRELKPEEQKRTFTVDDTALRKALASQTGVSIPVHVLDEGESVTRTALKDLDAEKMDGISMLITPKLAQAIVDDGKSVEVSVGVLNGKAGLSITGYGKKTSHILRNQAKGGEAGE